MEIFLIIFFIILVFIGGFCLWVIAKMGSLATDKEEQMEIERKLRKWAKKDLMNMCQLMQ